MNQIFKNEALKPILEKPFYLCFKLEWNEKKGKNDKPPYSPTGFFKMNPTASGGNYDKLRTATEATEAVKRYGYDGIGLVFRNDSPLAGIDIDNCIDEQGNIATLAAEIVAIMDSYTEYSPSGKGLHILFYADGLQLNWNKVLPEGEGLEAVEIYTEGRYFTLTGNTYGELRPIAERKAQAGKAIDMLAKWYKPKAAPAAIPASASKPSLLSDNEILERATNGKNGDKVKRLYSGDSSDYGNDASKGDLALCEMLAISAQLDMQAVDRIFRTSARMRNKWDEIHDRKNNRTYGQLTLDAAYSEAAANYVSPEEYKARKQAEERKEQQAMEAKTLEHYSKKQEQEETKAPFTVCYENNRIEAAQVPSGEILFITRDEATAKALADAGQYVLNAPVDKTAQVKGLVDYLAGQRPTCNIIFTYSEYKVKKAYNEKAGLPVYVAANLSPVDKQPITQNTINYLKGLIAAPDNAAAYVKLSMLADIEGYREAAKNTTGFKYMDEQLGGLAEGVYTMGAESGTGKTTLYWQIAEQIAATGKPVIFISVEQPRIQIITKGIARRLLACNTELAQPPTAHEIRLHLYSDDIADNVNSAWDDFIATTGNKINIVEGSVIDYPVTKMRAYIERFIERTGQRPVIFIDYLQLLTSGNDKHTERENIITCYKEIKDLSKAEHLIIFLISSLNRANYYTDITKEAMMGSGSIEYTSDALMALQLNCITADDIFSYSKVNPAITALKKQVYKKAMGATPRLMKLSIIKSRNTGTGGAVLFEYNSHSDYFKAVGWEDYKADKHFRNDYPEASKEKWADINRGKGKPSQAELNTPATASTEEPEEEQSFIYTNKDTGEITRDKATAAKWEKDGMAYEITPAVLPGKVYDELNEEPPEWMKEE